MAVCINFLIILGLISKFGFGEPTDGLTAPVELVAESPFAVIQTLEQDDEQHGTPIPGSNLEVEPYKCSVRLYSKPNFQGNNYVQWTKYKGACVNIKKPWRNVAQSVDTYDICVVLWSKRNCRGRAIRLQRYAYGTANLKLVKFNKAASSIQVCAGTDKKDPNSGPAPPGFTDE